MDLDYEAVLNGTIVYDPVLRNATWYGKWARQNFCSNCFKSDVTTKLFKCSRCHGVFYCGIDCQRSGFQNHRKMCRQIEGFLKGLAIHEASESEFEVSEFSADYMHACYGLVENYRTMGLRNHSMTALKLSHYYAMKKMKAHCFKGDLPLDEHIDWNVSVSLIALGELREAFNFIIHWIALYAWTEDPVMPQYKHFLKWEEKQYLEFNLSDFYEMPEELFGHQQTMLTIYFALVLIKATIVNTIEEHMAKREQFTAFMMGTHQRLGEKSQVRKVKQMIPVIQKIAQYVGVGKPTFLKGKKAKEVHEKNYDHVKRYMNSIHQINAHGLYSLTSEGSVKKHYFEDDEQGNVAMAAGTFARCLFEGLQNKEKMLNLAQNIV